MFKGEGLKDPGESLELCVIERRASKHESVFRRFCGVWWVVYSNITKRAEPVGRTRQLPYYARRRVYAELKRMRNELRKEILTETGGHCIYCDRHAAVCELTVDHLKASSRGGMDAYHNLAPACTECNRDKADASLDLNMVHPAWRGYVNWKLLGCRPLRNINRGNIRKWT